MPNSVDSLTTHQLLYSPFNKDYHVNAEIEKALTENEFIENCFVEPHFVIDAHETDDDKENAYMDESFDGYSFDFARSSILRKEIVSNNENSYKALINWLNDNANGIYCIKGDGGTGKSTFIHWLKIKRQVDNEIWAIIDLQKSIEDFEIHTINIHIPKFELLVYKAISALLVRIFNIYLPISEDLPVIKSNIDDLLLRYKKSPQPIIQANEVEWFFDESIAFISENTDKVNPQMFKEHIVNLCNNIQNLVDNNEPKKTITKLINVYRTFIKLYHPDSKIIIVFDNIERFIGIDEIYNPQIEVFLKYLRGYFDSAQAANPDISKVIKCVVCMRNTSVRMVALHVQSASFGGHSLDLTGWFPADTVISKKIKWYKKRHINIENEDIISSIVGDNSFDGHGSRSLQEKLGRMFNRDKRMIVNMLDRAINFARVTNTDIIQSYKRIIDSNGYLDYEWIRFAARSIIMRIVLDILRKDGFFQLIRTMQNNIPFDRLSDSRIILTILSRNFDKSTENPVYISFDKLMYEMTGNHNYLDPTNDFLMETVSEILFAMNYYNRRTDDWFRLIDIQYNLESSIKSIKNSAELKELLREKPQDVNIKIVDAGKGFLDYVIQSFEYFSCRYMNNNEYLPPLLCLVPTPEELISKNAEDLRCYRVIATVQQEAEKCINHMKAHNPLNFPFIRPGNTTGICHVTRIINAHTGYIGNFIGFMEAFYKEKINSYQFARKKAILTDKLRDIINKYEALRIE